MRFAPSPTGSLHVGGARTAIYNWAYARRMGGKFILRIEDTDPERSTVENTQQIIRALRWLGIDWDEGPEVGGDFGPYLQTERFDSYDAWLQKLVESDRAYPCFCSADELRERREQRTASLANSGGVASGSSAASNSAASSDGATNGATNSGGIVSGGPSGYDRRCRSIDPDEARARLAAGEAAAWRLKIPLEHEAVTFDDAVFGRITTPYQQLDDLVLVRSDGSPTYNYACVIDDIEMQITHVIRGNDHISNTPKQIMIYEAFETPTPSFAHLSMILGADGSRLSKRHGATSVEAYRDAGYLPEALVNYLTLLGWSLDGETTIIDAEKLSQNFSLERVSKNPAVFDAAKLDWMNSSYIKQMDASLFIDALSPYLEEAGFVRPNTNAATSLAASQADTATAPATTTATATQASPEAVAASIAQNRDWYDAIFPLVAERIKTLSEAIPMITYLFSAAEVKLDDESVAKCLEVEGAAKGLAKTIELLSDESLIWSHDVLESSLRSLPEQLDIKTKTLFQAIRVAICGNMVSPPLFESIELVGRPHTLARLNTALAKAQ